MSSSIADIQKSDLVRPHSGAGRHREKSIRVGCIGTGDIVRATHMPLLKAMRGIELAWLTDLDENRAREMARINQVPYQKLPRDVSQLPEADIYLLACPFGVREPYYEALAERSAAIYVEKPFSRDPIDHGRLCSLFPDYALASGLMMRCWGPNVLVKRLVGEGLFGPLRKVRFGFGKPGLVTQGRYYFDRERGGAGLMPEVGIHGVDSALFVSDAISADIRNVHSIFEGDLDLHTEANIRVRNQGGHSFDFELTVSALQDTIEQLEFEFDHATLSYPLPGQGYALLGEEVNMNVQLQSRSGGFSYKIQPFTSDLYPFSKFQMFHQNWEMFVEGVRTRQANATSAIQSVLTTAVLHDCYQAGYQARAKG